MKNLPYKYNNNYLYLFIFLAILVSGYIGSSTISYNQEILGPSTMKKITATVFFLLITTGFILRFQNRNYLYRKVNRNVEAKKLKTRDICYLNGQTTITYTGQDEFTHKYVFFVGTPIEFNQGLKRNSKNYVRLLPREITEYVSPDKEV